LVDGHGGRRRALRRHERRRLRQASRQHRPADRRLGATHRGQVLTGAPAQAPRLSERQRLNWLRLIRSDGIGPGTFRDLVNRFGSAESAIEALPELSARSGRKRSTRIVSMAEAEAESEAAHGNGARFVAIGEADYPPMLRRMPLPPPILAVRGGSEVFARPAVSIVGARNASATGMRFARTVARELGEAGFTIVSGLARGIDAAAHKGSLPTGTVAALAGGLDRPYPAEHAALCDAIVDQGGALISEMPFGWEPRARDFPRRNRLVAGLGLGLLVVEAAMRSGSLISARLAGEMGRIVFAVPGSPLDPRAEGANRLLKDGATMVTHASDIIEHLTPIAGGRPVFPSAPGPLPDLAEEPAPADDEQARVIEAMSATPVEIDDIIAHTGYSAGQVSMVLLELDLAGRLARHAGGRVSLVLGDP
jgi:DNA processing protein